MDKAGSDPQQRDFCPLPDSYGLNTICILKFILFHPLEKRGSVVERRGSVVVSMPAYQAADQGSNPARTRRDY